MTNQLDPGAALPVPQPLHDHPANLRTAPDPIAAAHVLWHHMARGAQEPPLPVVSAMDTLDRYITKGIDPGLILDAYPSHYGYLCIARAPHGGIAMLQQIVGEEPDRG